MSDAMLHDGGTRWLEIKDDFDLARTAAPVWWAGGRAPNTDWRNATFIWVGREDDQVVWRTVRQVDQASLMVSGTGARELDAEWVQRVLGVGILEPVFSNEVLISLSGANCGYRPWAAGSLFLGFLSTIVGQSISVAAAAATERRLFSLFNEPIELDGRCFWPPPTPAQLAGASVELIRQSGVTTVRAGALQAVSERFATTEASDKFSGYREARQAAERLADVKGIGPWTIQSALLWGVADPDAHPTGDVALLRAARKHFPNLVNLRELDTLASAWAPYRAWAARLLWLDLLGFTGSQNDGESTVS
jgi:3-methyladenine DNA glycosylase/8-oxoguanine DNA glycosylase